jgi:hypothetical protein
MSIGMIDNRKLKIRIRAVLVKLMFIPTFLKIYHFVHIVITGADNLIHVHTDMIPLKTDLQL